MKKKILLLSIVVFPSLIYFFFELTQANFKKMPYFGPKTINEKGDSLYYSITDNSFLKNVRSITDTILEKNIDPQLRTDSVELVVKRWAADSVQIDTSAYPVYAILFLHENLKKDGYKLQGLVDYFKYKQKDLKDIPLFFVSTFSSATAGEKEGVELRGSFDSLGINMPNFIPLILPGEQSLKSYLAATYFKQKPVYVFDYFVVLVDKKRHIRGYYDPSFNAEIKRMLQEYKHLKIRDEYAETLKQNDIRQNEDK